MPSPASVNNATGPSPSPPAPSPAQTQPPPQPGASGAGSAAPPTTRPGLPDRSVSENTVEDAYVDFILFCNPAVPLSTDTTSLREAFRNPPRSGGKSFSTFAIYELVRKFYNSEIRTWTELTTKLGVEPPDPNKEESAQKVAQYGVRLKVCDVEPPKLKVYPLKTGLEVDEFHARQGIFRVSDGHSE